MNSKALQVLVVVNDASDIKTTSTTADLVRFGRKAGWRVATTGVEDLGLSATGVATVVDGETGTRAPLSSFDLVLSRTNPARDATRALAHRFAMRLLTDAALAGSDIINDPRGLSRADSKAFLADFDEAVRPPMIVSQRTDDIVDYVVSLGGDAVVKPAHGTHGSGVIRLEGLVGSGDAESRRQVTELLARGPLVVQPFLSEAAGGDTRVILVDGALLEVNGRVCAVRRLPPEGDFRSNVAAGGKPARAEITPGMRRVVQSVGPRLKALGLWLVGLDFVGDQIIEVNAYSPGGLGDASAFEGADFGAEIFARLATRMDRRQL